MPVPCNTRWRWPAPTRFKGWTPVEMFGYTEFPRVADAPYPITLGAYGFYWFELTEPADLP